MMWWNGGGWGAGQWIAMSLMMLLFQGFLALVVYWIARSVRTERSPRPAAPATDVADQLLAERFARGEIDAEEYDRRWAVLHHRRPPT